MSEAAGSKIRNEGKRGRGRLVRHYFFISVLLVAGGLIASGGLEVYFRYNESKETLALLQKESAAVTALKIERFIQDVETAMKAVARWQAIDRERISVDYISELNRLLFLSPAITEAAALRTDGIQQAYLSRLHPFSPHLGRDFSDSEAFQMAKLGNSYFGPVYFARDSEPYMTIALPIERFKGNVAGVLTAEVNLKYVWEVVSEIRPGQGGFAYAVSRSGDLVAHPDIGLVLQRSNLIDSPQVQAAFRAASDHPKPKLTAARNLEGREVISSFALIPRLDWAVFVERPVEEAYQTLYGSVLRTSGLLLVGFGMAVLASLFVARRIIGPLRALGEGVSRIGSGDLAYRVNLKTGDEIEALAREFNRMAADLQEAYNRLEEKVADRTQELMAANEKLQELDKLKSGFVSNVSHELRTPLTAIRGLAANMLDGITGPLNDKQVGYLTDIKSSTDRLARLIDNLLDLSTIAAGRAKMRPATIFLAPLMQEVTNGLRTIAKRKLTEIEIRSLEPDLIAWADRDRIAQVLTNLIGNAIKFSPARGKVLVSAHRNGGAWVEICVTDTGPGIPDDQAEKIFDEFYQITRPGKEKSRGVGLGLAISKRLVEMHGGRIWVESKTGVGSTFHFTVPTEQKIDASAH